MEAETRSTRPGLVAPALALLAISLLVNYVDRGNLSIAAPLLKGELHLSASQLGILLSGFFWTYTALQFVSGWLAQPKPLRDRRLVAESFSAECAHLAFAWAFAWSSPHRVTPSNRLLVRRCTSRCRPQVRVR
jgi:MFS family permease